MVVSARLRPRTGQQPGSAPAAALAIVVAACCQLVTAEVTIKVAGSASLSHSDNSVVARAYRQGALLVALKINSTRRFKYESGEELIVDLTIEDDEGLDVNVDRIYRRLSDDSDIDLLLGPYSSVLSAVAAIQAGQVPKFIMLAGAASPEFFKSENDQIFGVDKFTTNVLAPNYFHDALNIAKDRSAQSVAFLHDGDTLFAGPMCDGAVEYAHGIGLHVLESRVKEEQIVEQVNHLKALGADVLVGCGDFDKVVDIVVSARALGYNPHGIILPFAASDKFLATVGAPNGNYILSPAPWVPAIDQECTLFGSTSKFVQEYRAMWGEEPLYQSAEAGAGILAALAAVELAGSASTPAVTSAMLEIDLPTFYGRLAFFANGSRRDAPMYTQQVLPQNFTRSRFELVGAVASRPMPAVWPMPSWREKELEVYPCGEGQVVNVSLGGSGAAVYACQSCERGMYRDPHSVTCEQCSEGSYGDATGMTACIPCPDGAYCPLGLRPGEPNATAGYYKLPLGDPLLIMQCDAGDCVGDNECSEHQTGILCMQCEPGYSRGRGKCTECGDAMWNALGIFLTFCMYALYIKLLVMATLHGSGREFKALHSVILKICVNYAMFAGIAFAATDFQGMVDTIYGEHAAALLSLAYATEYVSNPMAAMGTLDCLLRGTGVRMYQASVLAGLVLMPMAFFLKVTSDLGVKCLSKRCAACLGGLRRRLRKRRELRAAQAASQRGGGASPVSSTRSPRLRTTNNTSPAMTAISGKTKSTKEVAKKVGLKIMNSFVVMSFILHALVTRMLVSGLQCQQYDVLRQVYDVDVTCSSDDWMAWAYWSIGGIIAYGFGTPIILFLALYRKRNKLLTREVREAYGFLYNGFELKYWYFEPVYMFRKVAVALVFAFPSPWGRVLMLLFLSWGFILVHLKTRPFDNRSYSCFDRLDLISLVAFTATLTSRLIFDIREEFRVQYLYDQLFKNTVTDALLVGIPVLCNAWFLAFAMWSLFRNIVLQYLSLKQDVVGASEMTVLENALLKLESCKNHAKFEQKDGSLLIHIEELNKKEKNYLLEALSETTHRHMLSAKESEDAKERTKKVFRPDELSAILREALYQCELERLRKKKRLQDLQDELDISGGGVIARCRHVKGCLMLVLYGSRCNHRGSRNFTKPTAFSEMLELAAELKCGGCLSRGAAEKHQASQTKSHGALGRDAQDEGSFPVEDFYDSLAQLWQKVSDGRWRPRQDRSPRRCGPVTPGTLDDRIWDAEAQGPAPRAAGGRLTPGLFSPGRDTISISLGTGNCGGDLMSPTVASRSTSLGLQRFSPEASQLPARSAEAAAARCDSDEEDSDFEVFSSFDSDELASNGASAGGRPALPVLLRNHRNAGRRGSLGPGGAAAKQGESAALASSPWAAAMSRTSAAGTPPAAARGAASSWAPAPSSLAVLAAARRAAPPRGPALQPADPSSWASAMRPASSTSWNRSSSTNTTVTSVDSLIQVDAL